MIVDDAVARGVGVATRVLVTQPRRVAAAAAAARVAFERGEVPLDSLRSVRSTRSVGYTVHLQCRPPRGYGVGVCELSFGGNNQRCCVKATGSNCLHVYYRGAY
jgi:hypothetical protein